MLEKLHRCGHGVDVGTRAVTARFTNHFTCMRIFSRACGERHFESVAGHGVRCRNSLPGPGPADARAVGGIHSDLVDFDMGKHDLRFYPVFFLKVEKAVPQRKTAFCSWRPWSGSGTSMCNDLHNNVLSHATQGVRNRDAKGGGIARGISGISLAGSRSGRLLWGAGYIFAFIKAASTLPALSRG